MLAIISDIHGNLEALTAVLAEIDRRGVPDILCLGDVLGYGPNPVECLDLVRQRCRSTIMGNHDFAVFYEPYNFNTGAEAAAYWARSQLEADPDQQSRSDRWMFLANLPVRLTLGFGDPKGPNGSTRFAAVHASPRKPINEYIFPDDIYTNPGKFNALFERVERLCFVGHTHVPGVFLQGPDFYSPDELENAYVVDPKNKAIVNVGSVGQPRDRDPRSSFVILHTNAVEPYIEFVRLEYDLEATKRKVEAIPELDDFLGTRLVDGR
ncbi:MAG: metallophosphoesterase family protein [Planctomycetota bacterium]